MPSTGNSLFGEEVTLDQAMIVSRRGEGPTDLSTNEASPFLKLPSELRTMVYAPLIATGDLSVMTVSKLISQEAVSLLSKVACLRIKLGCPNLCPVTIDLSATITLSGSLTLIAPEYIQHVDFHLNMATLGGPPIDPKLISCFSGNRITRKSCSITITLAIHQIVPYQLGNDETYRAIAALTGFKYLVLKLEHERIADHDDSLLRLYGSARVNGFNAYLHQWLLSYYERFFAFLQTTLGPADFQREVKWHHLGFWPSEYKAGDCLVAAAKALRIEV